MTPQRLTELLQRAPVELPELRSPELLQTLEEAARAAPSDMVLREQLLALHAWLTASMGLPPTVAGVQRQTLVRWDSWSTTWIGMLSQDGTMAMVRTLRPHALHDPLLRRLLERDGAALRPVLEGLRHVDGERPALVLPLRSPSYQRSARGGHVGPIALARLVSHSLQHLVHWEHRQIAPADPTPHEIRDGGDCLHFACLTPRAPEHLSDAIRVVSQHILEWWDDAEEHPLADLLGAFVEFAAPLPSEAAVRAIAALASELADTRWTLERRARQQRDVSQRTLLSVWVQRLIDAMPPPRARGITGVDLSGVPLIVESDGHTITFGTPEQRDEVLNADGVLHVGTARRLVRSRASAPLSSRLNHEHQGTVEGAERLSKWTSARLELRTVRRLLEIRED
jgi:hypothetical protein